ncbi:hypothetical protein BDV06DRAFT_206731 [Aspergillus oleicola]
MVRQCINFGVAAPALSAQGPSGASVVQLIVNSHARHANALEYRPSPAGAPCKRPTAYRHSDVCGISRPQRYKPFIYFHLIAANYRLSNVIIGTSR